MSAPARTVQKHFCGWSKKNVDMCTPRHTRTHCNNCILAGLLVVGPLFQQSGFSLHLDRDQVRLHNTPLCLQSKREKQREKTAGVCIKKHVCLNMFWLWEYCTCVCVWACACVSYTPTTCSLLIFHTGWRSPFYLSPHCYIIRAVFLFFFVLTQHQQRLGYPWKQLTTSKRSLRRK